MDEYQGSDLYSDGAEAGATAPAPAEEETAETPPEKEEAKGEEPTALVPKGVFMGKDLKPGSRCEFEIQRVMDGEVEVKYVQHGDNESAEAPARMPSEMASMMED